MTRGAEIEAVLAQGKRIRTRHLELRIAASPLSHPRIGLIVGKRGHTSVERNRLKRRLREALRLETVSDLPPVDLVIRVNPSSYDCSFATLRLDVSNALGRLKRSFAP